MTTEFITSIARHVCALPCNHEKVHHRVRKEVTCKGNRPGVSTERQAKKINIIALLVGILLLTTSRFIDGKLLLRGQLLIERLLEQASSRKPLSDIYCTTVSFIQITHNPPYLVHHGSPTTKHLKCKVRQHQTHYCHHNPHITRDINRT